MVNEFDRRRARAKRHKRVRARVVGSSEKPRLCVYRSLKHIYVQAVDDLSGSTLASASSVELSGKGKRTTGNVTTAKEIGELIANRLKEKGLERAVFDRGGYLYHGRVKALADAARSAGMKF